MRKPSLYTISITKKKSGLAKIFRKLLQATRLHCIYLTRYSEFDVSLIGFLHEHPHAATIFTTYKSIIMKLIITTLAIFCISIVSVKAQKGSNLTKILPAYYDIKNALVASDAKNSSLKATEFVQILKSIDSKELSESDSKVFIPLQEKLNSDAKSISENTNIENQRDHFATLSLSIYTLLKAVKISEQPVYQEYCPMKKMYWLSNEPAIKNPYYGKMMLTCGKVTVTVK